MRPNVTRCCSAGQHPVFSIWTFGSFSPIPSPLWSLLLKPGHSVTPGEQHFTKTLNFITWISAISNSTTICHCLQPARHWRHWPAPQLLRKGETEITCTQRKGFAGQFASLQGAEPLDTLLHGQEGSRFPFPERSSRNNLFLIYPHFPLLLERSQVHSAV